jgi:hypothetical protein
MSTFCESVTMVAILTVVSLTSAPAATTEPVVSSVQQPEPARLEHLGEEHGRAHHDQAGLDETYTERATRE